MATSSTSGYAQSSGTGSTGTLSFGGLGSGTSSSKPYVPSSEQGVERTENDAMAEVAMRAAGPSVLESGIEDLHMLALPAGVQVQGMDVIAHRAHPRRKVGAVVLEDVESFGTYVNRHKTEATVLYASREAGVVTAILNDHAPVVVGPLPETDVSHAGWRDFRAMLRLAQTPEWERWLAMDGKWVDQVTFAEHIQAGELEIMTPPAAEMLDLAQHFEVKKSVAYESVTVLSNGQRVLNYEETVSAKQQKGQVRIPEKFTLGITPYEALGRYPLVARFGYRLNGGDLRVRYQLVRPDDVLRTAFEDVTAAVSELVGLPVLKGSFSA